MDKVNELLQFLARLLQFPTQKTEEYAYRSLDILKQFDRSLVPVMEDFIAFINKEGLERLQDIYTYTFDLQPPAPPYVGHHIFGEDYRRSYFMVGLKEAYKTYGYSYNENELPDHISVVLEFIPLYENEEEKGDLINLCLIPAVEKMRENLKEDNPYSKVLEVIHRILSSHYLWYENCNYYNKGGIGSC